jgi:hypothetical protein
MFDERPRFITLTRGQLLLLAAAGLKQRGSNQAGNQAVKHSEHGVNSAAAELIILRVRSENQVVRSRRGHGPFYGCGGPSLVRSVNPRTIHGSTQNNAK